MRTANSLLRGLLVAGTALASACAGDGEIDVLDERPDAITVRAPSDGELAGVTADQHCASSGKVSSLQQDKASQGLEALEDPGTAVFVFQCVDPGSRE